MIALIDVGGYSIKILIDTYLKIIVDILQTLHQCVQLFRRLRGAQHRDGVTEVLHLRQPTHRLLRSSVLHLDERYLVMHHGCDDWSDPRKNSG